MKTTIFSHRTSGFGILPYELAGMAGRFDTTPLCNTYATYMNLEGLLDPQPVDEEKSIPGYSPWILLLSGIIVVNFKRKEL